MNTLRPHSETVLNTLSVEEFYQLREVPPEAEWFANLDNANTRRAYQNDVREFMSFLNLQGAEQLRSVVRSHIIIWRNHLQQRGASSATIRRKMAAISSLYKYLAENNSILLSPVDGVKRPTVDSLEGKTPALSDQDARALLCSPDRCQLAGKRDYAILSTLLYHALRREELCRLTVKDIQERRGVKHLRIHGKGSKIRYIPAHPDSLEAIDDYLTHAGHGQDKDGALFRPFKNNRTGDLNKALSTDAIWRLVRQYAQQAHITLSERLAPHALRATAATNALEHEADITKVQHFLGHANISTTRIYDRRDMRPADSPVWRIKY